MRKNCSKNLVQKILIPLAIALVFVVLPKEFVSAITSQNISFQGKIVRNDTGYEGLNVTAGSPACVVSGSQDTCDFRVSYYTASTGGTLLFTEDFINVEIGNYGGVFDLSLGSGSASTTSQCSDGTCNTVSEVVSEFGDVYIQIQFAPDGSTLTETFARMPLEASPYSMVSQKAKGDERGFVFNPLSSAPSTTEGKVYYDSVTQKLKLYNGSSWSDIATGGSSYWGSGDITSLLYSQYFESTGIGLLDAFTVDSDERRVSVNGSGAKSGLSVYSSYSASTDWPLVSFKADGSSFSGNILQLVQDGTGKLITGYKGSNLEFEFDNRGDLHLNSDGMLYFESFASAPTNFYPNSGEGCVYSYGGDLYWDAACSGSGEQLNGATGGSSLWTDGGTFSYLTSVTDDLVLGATTVADSTFFFDVDGGSGNYLKIDNADNTSRLFTISSTGNVGIGTSSPNAKLDIGGSSSVISNTTGDITITPNQNLIVSSGNVGIGTSSPTYPLTVSRNLAGVVWMGVENTSSSLTGRGVGIDFSVGGNSVGSIYQSVTDNYLMNFVNTSAQTTSGFRFSNSYYNTELLFLENDGKVGIGTTSPTAKLHIVGTADNQQLIVKGNSTQTSNLTEWQNSSGTVYGAVRGNMTVYFSPKKTTVGSDTSALDATLYLESNTADTERNSGIYGSVYTNSGSSVDYSQIYGINGRSYHNGSGTVTNAYGLYFSGGPLSTGNITNYYGARIATYGSGTGVFSNVTGISIGDLGAYNSPTTMYGVRLDNSTGAVGTSKYGIYIGDVSGASSSNFAIYTKTGRSRFGDQVSIYGSSNTQQLIVRGYSTQTSNLQEWQNSSGTVLSSVDENGNIGIGTNNPTVKLDIYGSNGTLLRLLPGTGATSDYGYININDKSIFGYNGSVGYVLISDNDTSKPIAFRSGNDYRMFINPTTGNIGIGTNNPTNKLHVEGTDSGSAGIYMNSAVPSTTTNTLYNSGGNLYWNGSAVGSCSISGTAGYITKFATASTLGNSVIYESGGYVGIASTTPDAYLTIGGVVGTGNIGLHLLSSSGSFLQLTDTGSKDWAIGVPDGSQALAFFADRNSSSAGTEMMRITSDGAVGIGTSSPGGGLKLDVNAGNGDIRIYGSNQYTTGLFLSNTDSTTRTWYVGAMGNSAGVGPAKGFSIYDVTADNPRFTIDTSGNVGIGTITPGVSQPYSGRRYLTINGGSTDTGVLELLSSASDTEGQAVGLIQFTDKNSTATDKRLAAIYTSLSGTTANNRGGQMVFNIKADGGSLQTVMKIQSDAKVNLISNDLLFQASDSGDIVFANADGSEKSRIFGSSVEGQNELNIRIGGTRRMIIDSNGQVGINTTTPNGRLHISMDNSSLGATGAYGQLELTGATNQGKRLAIGYNTSVDRGYIQAITNGVSLDEFVINPYGGNVGIGLQDPGYKLDLPNTSGASGGEARAYAWRTYSSVRWKENIVTVQNALDKIDRLRGVYYDSKPENGGTHQMGFIAEEVGAVIPEVVGWEEDGIYAASLDYDRITALNLQGIKELHSKVKALQADNNIIVAKLSTLTGEDISTTVEDIITPESLNEKIDSVNTDLLAQINDLKTQLATLHNTTVTTVDTVNPLSLRMDSNTLVVDSDMSVLGVSTFKEINVGNIFVNSTGIGIKGSSCIDESGKPMLGVCEANTLFVQKGSSGNVNYFNGKIVMDPTGKIKVNQIEVNESSQSIGVGNIKAGTTSISINSDKISNTSKIFLTPTSNTKGQNIFISAKVEGESFTVSVSESIDTDITFDWFIVNTSTDNI